MENSAAASPKASDESNMSTSLTADPKGIDEFSTLIQGLLQQTQDRFQNLSDQIINRIDDMSKRIDDLEKNISDLMAQAGVEGDS